MFNFLKDFGFPAYAVGIISLAAFAYKRAKEFQEGKLETTKDQLDSIIDLFSDETKLDNPFIVEQVFHYKFKSHIPAQVIRLLLNTDNPTSSIEDYIMASRHLEPKSDGSDILFRGKMNIRKYRKKWKTINLIGYSVFIFLGLGLFMSLIRLGKHLSYFWVIGLIPLILYFLWIAYEFLMSALRISSAERIVDRIVRS